VAWVAGYGDNRFFFEFVVLVRRVVLIGVSVALVNDRTAKYSALALACIFFPVGHLLTQPFRKPHDNQAETVSLVILTIIAVSLISAPAPLLTCRPHSWLPAAWMP
jgi:hypothetical protein